MRYAFCNITLMRLKDSKKNVFIRYKVWLSSITGEGIMGIGKWQLLKEIEKEGSLKAATVNLGISYRKAWGDIKKAEEKLGFALTEKQRGGKKGGKSIITPRGKKLIEAYEALNEKLDDTIEKASDEFLKKIE